MEEKKVVKINKLTERFVKAVNDLLQNGVTRRDIVGKLQYSETTLTLILTGKRNVPTAIAEKFEQIYGIKITAVPDSMGMLAETAVRTLAGVEANRKAIAALYAAVLKIEPETASETLEALYRSEHQKLKAELLQKGDS